MESSGICVSKTSSFLQKNIIQLFYVTGLRNQISCNDDEVPAMERYFKILFVKIVLL